MGSFVEYKLHLCSITSPKKTSLIPQLFFNIFILKPLFHIQKGAPTIGILLGLGEIDTENI